MPDNHREDAEETNRARKIVGLIPARLDATRLPDKPLAEIAGKPMLWHVWERARRAVCLSDVYIATPDEQIVEATEKFGGKAIRTSDKHRSGTDRLAEAASHLGLQPDDIVVNIQGDEPLLDPRDIEMVVEPLILDSMLVMSSAMCLCPAADIDNPACVKVVCDFNGDSLYFSRARLPYPRKEEGGPVFQHIGLYAYRRDFLAKFASMPPSPLEQTESLEQLRVLENGYRIRMVLVQNAPIGVDTSEDLERVRRIIEK